MSSFAAFGSDAAAVAGAAAAADKAAAADPAEAARSQGLRYVDDHGPGIRRRRVRGRFAYFAPDGTRIRDADEIRRIDALAIPPAYADVWICPDPRGHLQATGRDARGRKQYRYHPLWRTARDATKYERMLAFGQALPSVRARVEQDLARPGLPREKVLATVVRLLDATLIRVGNAEYARDNRSYGLTTLRNRHVDVHGGSVRFRFRGKSGVQHDVRVQDARVARVVRRCMDLPGQELFTYLDDEGSARTIDSADVNDYLREVAQAEFTAKDYRTWAGSAHALARLRALAWANEAEAKRHVAAVIVEAARRLGNTPAVCRRCYVHPAILEAFASGALAALQAPRERQGLRPEEAALLAFLETVHEQAGAAAVDPAGAARRPLSRTAPAAAS